MITGLKSVYYGMRHLEHRGYLYIYANLLWVVLSLPIVTAPAAWAGLAHLSHVAQTNPTAEMSDLLEGFRRHFLRSLVLGTITLILVVLNLSNLLAYRGENGPVYLLLRAIWILALLVWFSLMLLIWPLYHEMEQPTVRGALRNAAVMMLLNPLYIVGLWLGLLPILIFSSVFFVPWLLITGGLIASIATYAVMDRLYAAGLKERPEVPPAEELS